jgi:hypothetical protein
MHEVRATGTLVDPPDWATAERALFDAMDGTAERLLALTDDGTPWWPPNGHVGIDGHDDVYEGFWTWPLYYALGGEETFRDRSLAQFDAVVDRFADVATPYGHAMAVEEYEQCRDWFHQGEGNLLFYFLGLAAPDDEATVERARRFAGFYLGGADDPGNYDSERRLVRAPMTGSMGPEYCRLADLYDTDYNWGSHGLPFDVDGIDTVLDAKDDANADAVADAVTAISEGDVPLNLSVTGLLANAYLHTGDQRYREWVTEYVDAWAERAAENGGIVPDNVGLNGEVGGVTGEWYGGHYGWSWGGFHYVGAGVSVGTTTATLLSGDPGYMGLLRDQVDELTDRAIVRSGPDGEDQRYVPHKRGPEGVDRHYRPGDADVLREPDGEVLDRDGWYEFKPMGDPVYLTHLWHLTGRPADRERRRAVRNHHDREWEVVDARKRGKNRGYDAPWLAYLDGEFPAFPERALAAEQRRVQRRIERIEAGHDPVDEDYLRRRNPVRVKALLPLVWGAPQPIYYGGLVHARVRQFDADRRRPGLPDGVAALVTGLDPLELDLCNLDSDAHTLVLQGGAYGEHAIEAVTHGAGTDRQTDAVAGDYLRVTLPAGSRETLVLELDRFARDPSYTFPWDRAGATE